MRFSVTLPTVGTVASPEAITEVAGAAAECGFYSVTVPAHVLIPEEVDGASPATKASTEACPPLREPEASLGGGFRW